jgi:hypothetical protein
MAYTDIDLPTDYFNTVLYTGNGGTQSITGVGFAPDWVWTKNRSTADSHELYDTVRGATKRLISHSTAAENTETYFSSFDSDGFTLTGNGNSNGNGNNIVAWNWLANGAGVSNTAGSITSTVSANTTSGFSIVSWTASGSGTPTIGHGLGAVPSMIIMKPKSLGSSNWSVYHAALGNATTIRLNNSSAAFSSYFWNSTTPSSTVFTIGTDYDTNQSGATMIAYCFAEKKGYSKFGSYTGNGSADGTFVYTGFKPAFVMSKRTDSTENWYMKDNKRDIFNPVDNALYANSNAAELTDWGGATTDYLSNGFKLKTTDSAHNASGGTYIYMAFAENPFTTSTGIPTTAR